MGGQIATLFYEKYPSYVKSLILCDTHFGLSNLSPQEIEKFINLRKEPLINGKEPRAIAPIVASTLIGDVNNKSAYEQLVNSMELLHKESYLKTIDTSMRTEHRHIFKTIDVPTFIMVGELDTLTPPSMSNEIMKEIKNSKLSVIPNAGHLSNIENPMRAKFGIDPKGFKSGVDIVFSFDTNELFGDGYTTIVPPDNPLPT